ncbi:hypothetical protein ACFYXQ_29705 [Nocardia jiangxiensis]|uniref:Uncharacterized protein n=1 Tax=Nocardia jiangxiensis TaxID=282685 RepID=A0ABW6S8C8_9NOCA
MTVTSGSISAIDAATDRLTRARAAMEPAAPVREFLGESDLDAAYEMQRRVIGNEVGRGARVVGAGSEQ